MSKSERQVGYRKIRRFQPAGLLRRRADDSKSDVPGPLVLSLRPRFKFEGKDFGRLASQDDRVPV